MGKAKQVSWRDAKPASIDFVSGPEEYLADRAIRSIRDQLKALDAGVEVHELLAGDYAPGQFSAFCQPIVVYGAKTCTYFRNGEVL